MIISPFTPLSFAKHKSDGVPSEYIQTFAVSDRILIEIIGTSSEMPQMSVLSYPDGKVVYNHALRKWDINEEQTLWFASLAMSVGLYTIHINDAVSNAFKVTDNDNELNTTTLIQYSIPNNRQRDDAIFVIDGMQHFFDFRVPGGFRDCDWVFAVDSEQFVTDHADIVPLYSMDSVQQKFTLGNSQGCPVWFAEMLNRLLCCDYVYFDGMRYARKEASVPEMTVQLAGVDSFVFTQNLQKVTRLNPTIEQANHLVMRHNNGLYLTTNNKKRII